MVLNPLHLLGCFFGWKMEDYCLWSLYPLWILAFWSQWTCKYLFMASWRINKAKTGLKRTKINIFTYWDAFFKDLTEESEGFGQQCWLNTTSILTIFPLIFATFWFIWNVFAFFLHFLQIFPNFWENILIFCHILEEVLVFCWMWLRKD